MKSQSKLSLRIVSVLLMGLGHSLVHAQFSSVIEVSQLSGGNGFALNGVAAGDASGTSVSGIGDLNDDGYPDLIIGAPFADDTESDAGTSYVLFGGPNVGGGFSAIFLSGLDGSNGFALAGVSSGDNSGSSVARAGDVNDDNVDDLVIGAPNANANGAESGTSYVVYGDANVTLGFSTVLLSGLGSARGLELQGVAAGDHTGASVGGGVDINDDGLDDLIIGAPDATTNSNTGSGNSYIVFGGSDFGGGFSTLLLSGLDGMSGFALNGAASGDHAGTSVFSLGDVNADGVADLIIGAPDADPQGNGSGSSHVLFGGDDMNGGFSSLFLSGFDGTRGFALNGESADDGSGRSVATAGDLNDDGLADLIVGAPGASPNGAGSGETYILFGDANINLGFSSLLLSSLDGTNGFSLVGAATGDASGHSVAPAGDVNGDGIDDLVIGAPGASANGAESGSAFVLFGGSEVSGGFSSLFLAGLNGQNGFRINGAAAGDRLGESVSGVGDINDDGFDDVIVGAPGADPNGNDSGNSYVIFGRGSLIFADQFEQD